MKLAHFLLCVALSVPCAMASDEPVPKNIAELRASIQKILTEDKTPAAGIALVSRDDILWVDGIGKADVANNIDATADTMFRIGSITKNFTALAVLKLVEEGRLTLNTPVRQVAPDIFFDNPWEQVEPVRLVHLLEHTAGFDDLALAEYANSDPKPLTLKEGLDYYPVSRTSRWRPGTYFSYCNSGPGVSAYMVEKVTGQPFDEHLRDAILLPLGMKDASLLLTETVKQRLAKGYGTDGVTELPYWHIIMRPAGALNASPREMANYVRMLINRGALGETRIVRPESIERMETPGTSIAARRGLRYGYGLHSYTSVGEGFVWHGHNGGMHGFLADLYYLPDEGLGMAVMINNAKGKTLTRIREVVQRYLIKDVPTLAPPPVIHEDLKQYEGYYRAYSLRIEAARFLSRVLEIVHVEAKEDRLVVSAWMGDSEDFYPVGAGRFRREHSPVATDLFTTDDGGAAILWGRSGLAYRMAPAGWVLLERAIWIVAVALVLSCILFALYWIPMKLLGRLKDRFVGVRALPLISIFCLAAGFVVVAAAGNSSDVFSRLGEPSIWSWGVFGLSVAFAVTAVASLARAVRARGLEIHRAVWWHSLLVSATLAGLALYLTYWGVVGIRTWL